MASQLPGEFKNPLSRTHDAPVSAETEAWARALCSAFGADPETIIGMPEAPRWRSWVGYAELAVKAAATLAAGRA